MLFTGCGKTDISGKKDVKPLAIARRDTVV
jgi:hypothetical protein